MGIAFDEVVSLPTLAMPSEERSMLRGLIVGDIEFCHRSLLLTFTLTDNFNYELPKLHHD